MRPDNEVSPSDDDCSEGRDGVVGANSFDAQLDGESGCNRESLEVAAQHRGSPGLDQQRTRHDADNFRVGQRKHREGIVSETMTVPRRGRRRSLARLFARSANSDIAASSDITWSEYQGGGNFRSASLPPPSRMSSHSEAESGPNSLSAFLSFKNKQASLAAALADFDGKPAHSDHHSCLSSVTMTDKDSDGENGPGSSMNSCTKAPSQSSISPADHRSDLIHTMGTVDFDDTFNEQRQSPELFQSCTSSTKWCSPYPEQEMRVSTLVSSDFSLSFMQRLRNLREYTLCTAAAAVASCDSPATTVIRYCKEKPTKTKSIITTPETIGTNHVTHLTADNESTDSETSSETLSVNKVESHSYGDRNKKEDNNEVGADSSNDGVDSIKDEEKSIETYSKDKCAENVISIETCANGKGDVNVGIEVNLRKDTIQQIDTLVDIERQCRSAHPKIERALTPRTDILEQHGWSHYHRYARHRQSSSPCTPPLVILPMNHMSRALVLNGGGDRANGYHHGFVNSGGAKDLTELRTLADELHELRNWRKLATKSLSDAREELKVMDKLQATKDDALNEVKKLRQELDAQRAEAALLTTALNERKHPLVNNGKMHTALSQINEEAKEEEERTSVEMVSLNNENLNGGVNEEKSVTGKRELRDDNMVFAKLQEQVQVNEIIQKESVLRFESMILARDEEISLLKSKHEQTTLHSSKLEEALDAANQSKDAIATELYELKVWNATVEIRLEIEQKARAKGNEKLEAAMHEIRLSQEKLIERDSELQEFKDQLDKCKVANKNSLEQLATLQDELRQEQDCKCQLDQKLKETEDALTEKHHEVSFLAACVKRLQEQLQATEESFGRRLMDERGPRLDENHRLKTVLSANEKETVQLKDELRVSIVKARKLQDALDVMNVMFEQKTTEITKLSDLNQHTTDMMEEMKDESDKMQFKLSEKENEITILQGNLKQQKQIVGGLREEITVCTTACHRLEQELLVVTDERNSLQADVVSKSAIISDLVSTKNRLIGDINALTSQKAIKQHNTIASDILEQQIKELKRELGCQQAKYRLATEALAGMETALLVRSKYNFFYRFRFPFSSILSFSRPWKKSARDF